jgi:hypothetical protein
MCTVESVFLNCNAFKLVEKLSQSLQPNAAHFFCVLLPASQNPLHPNELPQSRHDSYRRQCDYPTQRFGQDRGYEDYPKYCHTTASVQEQHL